MRRILSAVSAYRSELVRAVARGWDGFFFRPGDPTPLGLIRIGLGLLLMWDLGVAGLDLRADFGSDGWADPSAVREFLAERSPWAWSFWFWVPDGLLPAAWVGCLVVLALFTAGLASRLMAPLAWAIIVSTARRVPVTLFGFDQIASTWLLYLAATGASGQALSIDRLIARRRGGGVAEGPPRPTVSANLGLRLIQLHLALIYGAAGLAKLRGDAWWDGTAMMMILLTPEFRRFDLSGLAAYPRLLNLMTHLGLALELGYPILVWVRVLRPLVLVAAVLMHVGIDLTLGLTEFGLAMLIGNLAFVPGPWLRALAAGQPEPGAAR